MRKFLVMMVVVFLSASLYGCKDSAQSHYALKDDTFLLHTFSVEDLVLVRTQGSETLNLLVDEAMVEGSLPSEEGEHEIKIKVGEAVYAFSLTLIYMPHVRVYGLEGELQEAFYVEQGTVLDLTAFARQEAVVIGYTVDLEDATLYDNTHGVWEDLTLYPVVVDVVPLEALYGIVEGETFTVRGVVSAKVSHQLFFLTTESASFAMYDQSQTIIAQLNVGDDVVITGKTARFAGLEQLADLTLVAHLGEGEAVKETLLEDDLLNPQDLYSHRSQLMNTAAVRVVRKTVEAHGHINLELEFIASAQVMPLRYDARLLNSAGLNDTLASLSEGDVVRFENVVLGYYNGEQLLVSENTKVFEVTVDVPLEGSIQSVLNKAHGEIVEVYGVVNSITNHATFFIEDETHAMAIYDNSVSFIGALRVGDYVLIKGTRSVFNGLEQVSEITEVEVLGQRPLNDSVLITHDILADQSRLQAYVGMRVRIEQLELTSYSFDFHSNMNAFYRVGSSPLQLPLRYDNRLDKQGELVLFMSHQFHGDVYDVDGITLGWFNGPQLLFTAYDVFTASNQTPKEDEDETPYFEVLDLAYTGPRLDAAMFELPLYLKNPNYVSGTSQARTKYLGGGGVFEVYLDRCIDGDTSVFMYPFEIESKIISSANSTRYLNIDTPETWSGGEEVFGRPASLYVCQILNDAENIYLQTDPGDYLLGNHGRLLAWVWVKMPSSDEIMLLNYLVVQQGLGEVAYLFGAGETETTMVDGFTYTEWMHKAELEAVTAERGMHSSVLKDFYWDYELDQPRN